MGRSEGRPLPVSFLRGGPREVRLKAGDYVLRGNENCFRLDADNPVMSQVEWELLIQAIDESGSVLIQERHEPDRSLLGMTERKGERPRAHVLATQRFVPPLGSLNHLTVQG